MPSRCLQIMLSGFLMLAFVGSAVAQTPRRGTESVKVGQLRRNTQPGSTGYVLLDGIAGTRYAVQADEGLDLEPYLQHDVVLHGQFASNGYGRSQVLQVRRVTPMQPGAVRPAEDDTPESADPQAETESWNDPQVTLAQYEDGSDAFDNPFSDEPGTRVARRQAEGPSQGSEAADAPEEIPSLQPMADLEAQYYDEPYESFPGQEYSVGHPGPGWSEAIWVRGEYLLWWTQGMRLPPLVTTSPLGTARTDAGVLGESGTSILVGDEEVNDDDRSGFRIRAGFWANPAQRLGFEGEYFELDDLRTDFSHSSSGTPILARPFFDALNGQESAELVAFPNVIRGAVDVETSTRLNGAGARLRYNLCCGTCCDGDPCSDLCAWTAPSRYRLDWVAGYRFIQLKDYVGIRENLVSLDTANPGSFLLQDQFSTDNEFHGGELGMLYQKNTGPWMLELLTKVALGNVHQTVRINGQTTITESNTSETFSGGLLAQRTNIGTFERDDFAVVPEIGVTMGYQLTPHWRALVGYSMIYFSNVVRAGDQIDLDLNPNLLPPEVSPFDGPLRPAFAFDETDFWAQGLSVGLEMRR